MQISANKIKTVPEWPPYTDISSSDGTSTIFAFPLYFRLNGSRGDRSRSLSGFCKLNWILLAWQQVQAVKTMSTYSCQGIESLLRWTCLTQICIQLRNWWFCPLCFSLRSWLWPWGHVQILNLKRHLSTVTKTIQWVTHHLDCWNKVRPTAWMIPSTNSVTHIFSLFSPWTPSHFMAVVIDVINILSHPEL